MAGIWQIIKICPGVALVTLGTDWYINLINAFGPLKSKNELSFFVVNKFFTTSHWQHWWYRAKFHVDDKKLLMRKSNWLRFHFASSVNSLTQSQNSQEKFSSQWSFWWLGQWSQETFDSWQWWGINFSSSRPCYHCGWHVYRTTLLTKTNYCLRSFSKNISFLLYWIHTVKM